MFIEMLRTQWKWSRFGVVIMTVAAFTLPLLSIQPTAAARGAAYDTVAILAEIEGYSDWFGGLALALGLLLATLAWSHDHAGKHVYALSLPVPRWYYALLRYSVGIAILAIPAAGMWVGTLVASVVSSIPSGLQAYPHATSFRFALASMLAFSVFFAISAGTTRTAAYVLTIVGAVVAGQVGLSIVEIDADVFTEFYERLMVWPGPFEIFTGRWMLIDV